MSISLNANFELLSAGLYLDARQQFNTIIEMKDFAETSIPDGLITYNKETQKHYVFNSSNTTDVTLGKWREYNSGDSSSATYATWNSNVDYKVGNVVLKDEVRYSCIADHTSTDFETDSINWVVVLEQYYYVSQAQYNQMITNGIITDETKDLYIIDGNSEGGNSSSAIYTSLSELGLTADATFQDIIDALPKGGSALLGVKEFTNYQTIFPYEEGNDQFARVYIVKGIADGSCMYARWFRKDGSKEAIAIFNKNDNKFSGWKVLVTKTDLESVRVGTYDFTNDSDWNNMKKGGRIAFGSLVNIVNTPVKSSTNHWGMLEVDSNADSSYVVQTCMFASDSTVYKRIFDGVRWSTWKLVCATSVGDVPKTTITPVFPREVVVHSSGVAINYIVRNGWCNVNFNFNIASATTFSWTDIATGLPKPANSVNIVLMNEGGKINRTIPIKINSNGTVSSRIPGEFDFVDCWSGNISYPVAE